MPPIAVSARRGAPEETEADTRVVGVFEGETPTDAVARELLDAGEAKAGIRKVAVGHEDAAGGRRRDTRPSLPLASYAGRYTDRMYGDVTIAPENERLVLRFSRSPALTGELEHWQYDTFVARWRQRNIPDAYVTFALEPGGSIETMKMAAVSPLADFSYDFQDLLFEPAAPRR